MSDPYALPDDDLTIAATRDAQQEAFKNHALWARQNGYTIIGLDCECWTSTGIGVVKLQSLGPWSQGLVYGCVWCRSQSAPNAEKVQTVPVHECMGRRGDSLR